MKKLMHTLHGSYTHFYSHSPDGEAMQEPVWKPHRPVQIPPSELELHQQAGHQKRTLSYQHDLTLQP